MTYSFEIISEFDDDDSDQNCEDILQDITEKYDYGGAVQVLGAEAFYKNGFFSKKMEKDGMFIKATKTESDGSQSLVHLGYITESDNTFHCPLGLSATGPETVTDVDAYHAFFEFAQAQGCETFVFESHPDVLMWKAFKQVGPHLDYPVTYSEEGDSATMTIDLR